MIDTLPFPLVSTSHRFRCSRHTAFGVKIAPPASDFVTVVGWLLAVFALVHSLRRSLAVRGELTPNSVFLGDK